jgi:putative Mn2+ efflux pump MntP
VLAVVLFAVAISIDGFLVGIAQGMRGIRVPLSTLIVINTVSAVVVFLSLSSGRHVANWLSPGAAKLIGSGILITMGALMLKPLSHSGRQTSVRGRSSRNSINEGETACSEGSIDIPHNTGENTSERTGESIAESIGESAGVNIPSCTVVVSGITGKLLMIPKFLAEPATADLDSSGTLTPDEGFFLGLALAIDALSVGFGAGMAGLSSVLTPIMAGVTQGMFVNLGLALGRKMQKRLPVQMMERAPGGILILLGAMRLK